MLLRVRLILLISVFFALACAAGLCSAQQQHQNPRNICTLPPSSSLLSPSNKCYKTTVEKRSVKKRNLGLLDSDIITALMAVITLASLIAH